MTVKMTARDRVPAPLFSVGREFHSFDELTSAVKGYKYANSVTLYTRSSRSIEAAKKRAPKRHFWEGLVHSEIDYACTTWQPPLQVEFKGDSEITKVSAACLICARDIGLLICCSTFLKECPFIIKIRTSGDGQKLCVKEVSGEHNHELSKVCVTWCFIYVLYMHISGHL